MDWRSYLLGVAAMGFFNWWRQEIPSKVDTCIGVISVILMVCLGCQ